MTNEQKIAYLDTLTLPEALFWFIENTPEEGSEIYFYLRTRFREYQEEMEEMEEN